MPALLGFCLSSFDLCALQTVTVAWDANTEPDIAGYKVYYGTASRNYSNVIDVGKVTSFSVPSLLEGTTYYFAVIAYSAPDGPSDYSPEISYTIPTFPAPISVTIQGSGTVTPNLNGLMLDLGRSYTITASPAAGYAFSGWSGTISATTPQLTFVMQPGMTLVATFVDNTAPAVVITSPATNLRVTNSAAVTLTGAASDNTSVARVLYRVGGGAFQVASGATAWSASVSLAAGANLIEVQAVDTAGNQSAIVSRTITNVVASQLTLTTAGQGTVTPNLNGQLLEIGKSYTITAAPAAGYGFSGWSGTVSAATAQLTFLMQSNMTLIATFVDNSAPTVAITSPAANLRVTNSATAAIGGTASDNTSVARVLYRIGGGAFQVASGTTAWSATVNLAAGANLIEAQAVDNAGNQSAIVSRAITNVVASQLTLTTIGQGTVTPNLNGQLLEIGKSYTITAAPASGYAFSGWSGTISATTAQLTFVMQANMNLVATFVDNSPPTVSITAPATNLRLTNTATVVISGSASDNTSVTRVLYRVGGGAFQLASGTTAWSGTVNLVAGANLIEVQAVDSANNQSAIVSRTITNVVGSQLIVTTTGQGTVTPDLNGQVLEIGKTYTVTATPATGYAFSNWSGTISAPTAQLTWVMQANMNLVANFFDISRPTLTIISPAANVRVTNGVATISGTSSDNTAVAAVLYRVGVDAFQQANGTTTWSATVNLAAGPNRCEVKSVDNWGNESPVAVRFFTNVVAAQLTVLTFGPGTVSPDLNGQWLEIGVPYVLTAQPAAGYGLSEWSGDVSVTTTQLNFVMRSNMMIAATFVDIAKPTITITTPASDATVTNSGILVQGTAGDNADVTRVLYALNEAPFQTATGTASWSVPLTLTSKTNLIRVKCVDSSGNESAMASRSITYSAKQSLRVGKRGKGQLTPNLDNQWLELGTTYTMTATADTGYTFADWSGSLTSTNPKLTFVMQSNLTLMATFTDSARPIVSVTSPTNTARLTNGLIMLRGRASDNGEVAQVLCSLNGGPFQVADGTTNWSAPISLRAGTNIIRVKSVDLGGLESPVLSQTLMHIVRLPILVNVSGEGTATPTNNQPLEIGKAYTAAAKPRAGYALTSWTGSILTNRTNFTFIMGSNFTLTANFIDIARPKASIVWPTNTARLTNGDVIVSGRASDNRGVSQVLYQLNDGPFFAANGTTNWSAPLRLRAGRNSLRVKAIDVTGYESLIVSQAVTYVVMFPIQMNVTGLGTVTPTNGQSLEIGKVYTAAAKPAVGFGLTNWTGSFITNRTNFTFTMQSNLTFTANFVDVMKPTISVSSPVANARLTNSAAITLQGRSSDNLAVSRVLYGLNDGPWTIANGTTNWSTPLLDLPAGPNKLRVKAIDVTGLESASVTQIVTYVVMWPVVVAINGNGTITPNLNGQQLEIGKSYTMTAMPAAGHLLSNWVGSVYSESSALTFVMRTNFSITAQFVPNPFIATKGTYNGLFYEPNGILHHSSGLLKVSITDQGAYSASLLGDGVTVPFSGRLRLGGDCHVTLARPGLPPVTIDLQLDLANGTEQLSGSLSDGTWVATYLADRIGWNTTNNPLQGRYTVVLPGRDGDPESPAGHGYGSVLVDRAGNLVFGGRSGDGQTLSQTVGISRNGVWPFYAASYNGKGSILGWLTFTNIAGEPIHGMVSWIRTPIPNAVYYRDGFSNDVAVSSSILLLPTNMRKIVNLDNIRVVASQGNLSEPVTNYVQLTWASTIWNTNSVSNFTLALNKTNGVFNGTFRIPGTTVSRSFYGMLLQNRNAGYGYFLGTNEAGQVRLEAP
jgi:uncharacterized repeat protein (TIGR02543 family)